jgi:hypothetical protein
MNYGDEITVRLKPDPTSEERERRIASTRHVSRLTLTSATSRTRAGSSSGSSVGRSTRLDVLGPGNNQCACFHDTASPGSCPRVDAADATNTGFFAAEYEMAGLLDRDQPIRFPFTGSVWDLTDCCEAD